MISLQFLFNWGNSNNNGKTWKNTLLNQTGKMSLHGRCAETHIYTKKSRKSLIKCKPLTRINIINKHHTTREHCKHCIPNVSILTHLCIAAKAQMYSNSGMSQRLDLAGVLYRCISMTDRSIHPIPVGRNKWQTRGASLLHRWTFDRGVIL